MTERPQGLYQDETSEDAASLYSQAYKRGMRYWDFSASRADVQRQFRMHMLREPAARSGPSSSRPRIYREPAMQQIYYSKVASLTDEPQGLAMDFEAPFHNLPAMPSEPTPPAETGFSPADIPPEVSVRQTSRSRWQTLRSVFEPAQSGMESSEGIGVAPRVPTTVVFSLAGGVGKTCLVATLGRALSSLGEQVLLTDTEAEGLLPFYFGSRENRPGALRVFPLAGKEKSAAPIRVLSLAADQSLPLDHEDDPLLSELAQGSRGMSRILFDLATHSRELASRLLSLEPVLLVPLLPDVQSVATLKSLESWRSNESGRRGDGSLGITHFYVLNQFDHEQALHLDVREMLQQRLGDRLLPFELHRSLSVSEALAAGMTVIDYAPESSIADDYRKLASWIRSLRI